MRSSRVAGKPQLIRSDMLLPVKSQNTTLFSVTWIATKTTTTTTTTTAARIEFGPLDVLSREHGFLYYATHTSWTTQSGITTLLRLSFSYDTIHTFAHVDVARALTTSQTNNKLTHTSRDAMQCRRELVTDIVSEHERILWQTHTHTQIYAFHSHMQHNRTEANRQPSEWNV